MRAIPFGESKYISACDDIYLVDSPRFDKETYTIKRCRCCHEAVDNIAFSKTGICKQCQRTPITFWRTK